MAESKHFIHEIIDEELKEGGRCYGKKVHTRFPPEPNGYLHIGHAKALEIDFGTAELYGGLCNLRMDDTNPTKEDEEYVDAIKEDIKWLGHDWGDRFFYASEYFEKMYGFAVELIKKGLAYVCELTPEQMKEMRGDINTPAQSPFRDRPIEESLDLFERMRNGEFEDGSMTLRAKIDLTSGNFNMRDPVIRHWRARPRSPIRAARGSAWAPTRSGCCWPCCRAAPAFLRRAPTSTATWPEGWRSTTPAPIWRWPRRWPRR